MRVRARYVGPKTWTEDSDAGAITIGSLIGRIEEIIARHNRQASSGISAGTIEEELHESQLDVWTHKRTNVEQPAGKEYFGNGVGERGCASRRRFGASCHHQAVFAQ